MKKILLPITLTALAPTICLVGCGGDTPEPPGPEPVYQPYEIKWDGESYKSDSLTMLKDNYYKFWLTNTQSLSGTIHFFFLKNKAHYTGANLYVCSVMIDNKETMYQMDFAPELWILKFSIPFDPLCSKIEINLRCMGTSEVVQGCIVQY